MIKQKRSASNLFWRLHIGLKKNLTELGKISTVLNKNS